MDKHNSSFLCSLTVEQQRELTRQFTAFARSLSDDKEVQANFSKKARVFSRKITTPKPMTANRLFLKERHGEIMAGRQENTVKEFSRVQRELWAAVKANPDTLADYERRAAEYNEDHGIGEKKVTGTKRPLSPYFAYMGKVRPELKRANPEWDAKRVNATLSQMWKALSDEEKATWKTLV
jgi:hypothetical protein